MSDIDQKEYGDDVVVIEEKGKIAHITSYVVVSLLLGATIGGFALSSVTESKWREAYAQLETKYLTEKNKASIATQKAQEAIEENTKTEKTDTEKKIEKEQTIVKEEHDAQMNQLNAQIAQLEKKNKQHASLLTSQQNKIEKLNAANNDLTRRNELQLVMLQEAKGLFRRELQVTQELSMLEAEAEELQPRLSTFKKECDIYLKGESWDVKSDACDQRDNAQSRLSQIQQMINVHKMDIKQIRALTDDIGM